MGLFKRKQFDPTTSSTAATTHHATHDDHEKRSRKKSVLNYVFPKSRVSEATLQVFRQLPSEIRHDVSMINFQREAERWNGEFYSKIIFCVFLCQAGAGAYSGRGFGSQTTFGENFSNLLGFLRKKSKTPTKFSQKKILDTPLICIDPCLY